MQITFRVKIYSGYQLEREQELEVSAPGVAKIGRLASSQIALNHESVSRMHAVLEVSSAGQVHVTDLGSAKGTHLNGKPVSRSQVKSGDELTVGEMRLIVSYAMPEQAVGSAETSSSKEAPAGSEATVAPTSAQRQEALTPKETRWGAAQDTSELDVTDGTRAVEITTMFEDSVLGVHQLEPSQTGRVHKVTWLLIGVGFLLVAVGLGLMVLAGQHGFGALLSVIGLGNIVYAYNRLLLERRPPNFTIGPEAEADFHVSNAVLPTPLFPLVQNVGGSFYLNFSEQMRGEVVTGERLRSLEELAASEDTKKTAEAGVYTYALSKDARIRVRAGKCAFMIRSVAPARRVVLPFWARWNWAGYATTALSFGVHGLVLFLIYAVPPDAENLSVDLFNSDNKLVRYLVQPPEEKEAETPEFLKGIKQPKEKEGGGKRHKGPEGKMGDKDSKKKDGSYGLKGPADTQDPHLARQLAEQAAEKAGVVGMLKSSQGGHLASMFGSHSALGTDTEDAFGGLIGDRIGEAYGVGGLGLVGTGRGGGGTGEGTVGLGNVGTIGRGSGTGTGANYGRRAGKLAGREASAPTKVVAGQAEVRGSLDKEIIRRIIRRHINEVKYCYQKELQMHPELHGRVVVQFTIQRNGLVATAMIKSSTMGSSPVEQCIAKAVRRWQFPKPKGGGIVVVSYPFVLKSAGAL